MIVGTRGARHGATLTHAQLLRRALVVTGLPGLTAARQRREKRAPPLVDAPAGYEYMNTAWAWTLLACCVVERVFVSCWTGPTAYERYRSDARSSVYVYVCRMCEVIRFTDHAAQFTATHAARRAASVDRRRKSSRCDLDGRR